MWVAETPWTASGTIGGDDCPVIGGEVTPSAGGAPVAPPMTPPVVGGLAAGEAGVAEFTVGTDPAGGAELFVAALFVGAQPPRY
jgi:hypothetical protein